jgi:hypothetical protein
MAEGTTTKKMPIKNSTGRKIFIVCAAISVLALCVCSLFFSWRESEKSAEASFAQKTVKITIPAKNTYEVGQKYSVSWSSDCRGGEAIVWLSSASSSTSSIGILVPLANFSASNFGSDSSDDRIFFNSPWDFDLSHNANKGKFSWTIPSSLDIPQADFSSQNGVYYIYTLADGRIALHKIIKEPVKISVMKGKYYLRVDIKGKNGCTATGYSQAINVIN